MRSVYNIHSLRSRRRAPNAVRRRTSPSGESAFEPLAAKHVIVAVGPQPAIRASVYVREKEKEKNRNKIRSTTCLGEEPIASRASVHSFERNLNFISIILYPPFPRASDVPTTRSLTELVTGASTTILPTIIGYRVITDTLAFRYKRCHLLLSRQL